MEQNDNPESVASTASTQETVKEVKTEVSRPMYSGDKGDVSYTFERNPAIEKKNAPLFSYGRRVRIEALHANHEPYLDHLIEVAGWARTTRMGGKDFAFIELTDGSGFKTLQVVVDSTMPNFQDIAASKVGASYKFKGKLVKSIAKGQVFDLQVCEASIHSAEVIGHCPGDAYPLAKKRHTVEFLRDIAHLRPRTKLISSVTRVRNNLSYATHKFFQERGFNYIHTPIITASDCEGAGEMFQVTTALPKPEEPISKMKLLERVGQESEVEETKVDKPVSKKQQKKAAKKDGKAGEAKPEDGEAVATDEQKAEEVKPVVQMIPLEERKVDYKKDFFGKPAFLTVSGQLNVENFNAAIGDVYTFGPTFRAEESHTSRHLAEFWMIEPELCFATLSDVMDCAEDYLKYCLRYVLENNADDIDYFNEWVDKTLKQRMQDVVAAEFKRLTYTEAIEILIQDLKDKKIKFEVKPEWGMDMGSEHERYLAEKVFKSPIMVYNYPKTFKAFYMRQNEDGKTVQAMDMLVPGIGELIGGSAREERPDRLDAAIKEKGLELEPYWWYRELRQFGTQPHGGFGLGFERLVMMATGVENIRDVIPFPRAPKKADF